MDGDAGVEQPRVGELEAGLQLSEGLGLTYGDPVVEDRLSEVLLGLHETGVP